jgi:predicted HicB family RNase H-like nuclease
MTHEILQYKGYYGSVNFSAEDKYFWGIIFQEPIGINDVVSFEGLTLVHLKSAFEKAVDSYLHYLELKKEPQNVLQYNKMCAEFLGAIYSEHAEAWGFGNAKNIGSKMFHGVMYHNVIEAQRFEKELKFHSDWKWIIEVVEAIEKLGYDVVIAKTSCSIKMNKQLVKAALMLETKKEAVVEAINKFLIWYEKNKI